MLNINRRIGFLLVLGIPALTYGVPDCNGINAARNDPTELQQSHHPTDRPLPRTREFNQPDGCIDQVWLFDQNRNQQADPGEVRLFGQDRSLACASCHGESPDQKSGASASVFLRQDAARLCLVCHNL